MAKQNKVDLDAVGRDIRRGLTMREASEKYGVSHVTIKRWADKFGWQKDLADQIQKRADAIVNEAEIAQKKVTEQKSNNECEKVTDEKVTEPSISKNKAVSNMLTEKKIIDANAEIVAGVKLRHRSQIKRSMDLVAMLLEELEITTRDNDLFHQLGELMRSADEKDVDKLNDIYKKVMQLPTRVDSIKKLSEALKTLIAVEREAYGMKLAEDEKEIDNVKKGLAHFYSDL